MALSSRTGVLSLWTLYPLEDFEHIIPVFEEVDEGEEERYEDGPDDEEWFILAEKIDL